MSSLAPLLGRHPIFNSRDTEEARVPACEGVRRLACLFAETLPRGEWASGTDTDLGFIKTLVAVHSLREVMCLYGFTHIEAAPTPADGDL